MQFIFDGEFYKAVKIVGPRHNMLGLSFFNPDEPIAKIEIIELKKDGEKINISSSEVENQVKEGAKEINKELNIECKIKKIEFVVSDSPSKDVYKELTKEIVRRVYAKNSFKI